VMITAFGEASVIKLWVDSTRPRRRICSGGALPLQIQAIYSSVGPQPAACKLDKFTLSSKTVGRLSTCFPTHRCLA
jgi:hypothetical protein